MAFEGFLEFSDPTLADKFWRKKFDPAKDRKAFIKRLETTKSQFDEKRTKAPNRLWSLNDDGDTVHFVPMYRGESPFIKGELDHYVAAESFLDALDKLIADVKAGDLDDFFEEITDSKEITDEAPAKSNGRGGRGVPRGPRDFDATSVGQASTKINGMAKRTNKPTVAQAKAELKEAGYTNEAINGAIERHKSKLA